MLVTLVDVVSCENPECRDFARIVPHYQARTYYCPVCGNVSHPRTVEAGLADKPEDFESYLCRLVATDRARAWSPPDGLLTDRP